MAAAGEQHGANRNGGSPPDLACHVLHLWVQQLIYDWSFVYYNGQMNADEAVWRFTEVVRRQHLALATERTCCAWLGRYCDVLKGLPLHLPSEHKLERFLTVLARKDVAASSQNQAFNAITFFDRRRQRGQQCVGDGCKWVGRVGALRRPDAAARRPYLP